jgi:hypothetical protein
MASLETGWLSRVRPHAAPIGLSVLLLSTLATYLCLRQDNEWERVFVPAAARLWTGDDLYSADGRYQYPPFTAWLTLPWVGLSHGASRIAFVAVSLICTVSLLGCAWCLTGVGTRARPAARWAVAAGSCCGLFYLFNCLVHQQTDVVIAALLIGGCLALQVGRPIAAATGFGLATAMKCTPLLFAPYLVWRGRPLAAAWLVVVALGVNFLPDLVSHPREGGTWLGAFAGRLLSPLGRADHVPGSWGQWSEVLYNQSLAGAAQRWSLTVPQWDADRVRIVDNGSSVAPGSIRMALLAVEAVLLLLAASLVGRHFRASADPDRETLEYGIVLCLMLLLSPMSSAAHFCTLLLPGMGLARRFVVSRDRILLVLLAAALSAAVLSNKDLIGQKFYTMALWGGCVMFNTLFLLVASLRELSRSPALRPRLALSVGRLTLPAATFLSPVTPPLSASSAAGRGASSASS